MGVLLLAALYCLAMGHVAGPGTEFPYEQQNTRGISFADASGYFLCATDRAQGAVNAFKTPPSGAKDTSKGFATAIHAFDRSHRTAFAEHSGAFHAVRLALWRSAILFPFHVFW